MTEKQQDTKRMGWGVRHIQMACMCLCITTLMMVRSSMGVAVLAMTDTHRNTTNIKTYNWDKNTQGVILSSFFWGYTIMQIPSGIMSKKFGGKPVLLFSLIATGVLSLLVPIMASVGGWRLVCACRVATGLVQAFTFPASHTLLGRWLPSHERVLLSGIVYGGTQLGPILGMPVSGFLAGTSLGWPLVFYAMAALMFFTAGLWYWMTASSPAEHQLMTAEEKEYIEMNLNSFQGSKPMRIPWRHILTSRPVWATVMAHIGTAYCFILFFVDMPTYLEKGLGISLSSSALLSALPYIGMWSGAVMSSTICEKVYNKGLLSATACRKLFNSIGAVGISIGLLVIALVPQSTTSAVVWLIGSLTFSGFYSAGYMMNHLDLSPNLAGLLLSLTNFIANLSCVSTPILTSFILQNDPTDLSRWHIVFTVAAGVSFVTNALYVLLGTSTLQPWDDPEFLEKEAHPEEMKPVLVQEQKKDPKRT